MSKRETIIQKTARLTEFSEVYVRQVKCGIRTNESISKMILTLEQERLKEMSNRLKKQQP